jgi:hypothetical protein
VLLAGRVGQDIPTDGFGHDCTPTQYVTMTIITHLRRDQTEVARQPEKHLACGVISAAFAAFESSTEPLDILPRVSSRHE